MFIDIIRIIALVLAVAALPGALLRVLPIKHETGQRLVPLFMVATGIGCWYAPLGVVLGVAAVVPASWLAHVLGIEMVPSEPANWSPLASSCKALAAKVKNAVATVCLPRIVWGTPPQLEPEVTQFVKPGDPGVLGGLADTDAPVDGPGDLEPPAHQTQVPRYVPSLLG